MEIMFLVGNVAIFTKLPPNVSLIFTCLVTGMRNIAIQYFENHENLINHVSIYEYMIILLIILIIIIRL